MINSDYLYSLIEKNVKLIDKGGQEYIGRVDFYESEYDSGSGVAEIGLSTHSKLFRADEIKSIEEE